MHYNAAVVAGCLRGSDLLSDYVSTFFVVVEQDRGVHISNTAQMLSSEVKFVKEVGLWEETTYCVVHLAGLGIT